MPTVSYAEVKNKGKFNPCRHCGRSPDVRKKIHEDEGGRIAYVANCDTFELCRERNGIEFKKIKDTREWWNDCNPSNIKTDLVSIRRRRARNKRYVKTLVALNVHNNEVIVNKYPAKLDHVAESNTEQKGPVPYVRWLVWKGPDDIYGDGFGMMEEKLREPIYQDGKYTFYCWAETWRKEKKSIKSQILDFIKLKAHEQKIRAEESLREAKAIIAQCALIISLSNLKIYEEKR